MRYEVRWSDEQIAELSGLLEATGARAADMRPAYEAAGTVLLDAEHALFASGGATGDSGRWAPLSAATLRRHPGHAQPLTGGVLQSSWTTRRVRFSRLRVDRNGVTFGSADPVNNLMQSGTRNMPARPVLAFGPDVQERAFGVLRDYLLAGTFT